MQFCLHGQNGQVFELLGAVNLTVWPPFGVPRVRGVIPPLRAYHTASVESAIKKNGGLGREYRQQKAALWIVQVVVELGVASLVVDCCPHTPLS